jgi:hypothetical protein
LVDTLHDNSTIQVGVFQVPFTADLRDEFARIHDDWARKHPDMVEFSAGEQWKLLEVCDRDMGQQQMSNRLELVHYLARQGVPVQNMLDFHCDPTQTVHGFSARQLSVRIAHSGLRPYTGDRKAPMTKLPQFLAPDFSYTNSSEVSA